MKKPALLVVSAVVLIGLLLSLTGCPYVVSDLIAGGGNEASQMDVGDVLVCDDGEDLSLGAVMANWTEIEPGVGDFVPTGWAVVDAHAHVALAASDVPQKNGNPRPGRFDFHCDDGEWEDGDAGGWEIELTEAMKTAGTIVVALHLEVMNDQGNADPTDNVYESVWADGTDFDGKNWATYFTYDLGSNPCPD